MTYSPPIILGQSPGPILSPASPQFAVAAMVQQRPATVATTAWPSANKPVACEFWLFEPYTVSQLGWLNGSGTMTDSADLGVYDASYNLLVSTGSTARGVASTQQWTDVADTVLAPGRYRLAMANNGTTAGQQTWWAGPSNAVMWGMLGLIDSTTNAFALPNPLTNMVSNTQFVNCPVMYIAGRALV